jgi:2-polyprenyl-3-methyl-5-hydroxy-6-metoxy-1,4-benzoquinol methylase
MSTAKDDLQNYWDRNAKVFDSLYDSRGLAERTFNRVFRRAIFERVERTARRIVDAKPDATVLDVGCGSGRTSIPLAKAGAGRVVGIDFAPHMVELARSAATAAGVENRVEYLVGDFAEHKFDMKFDFVVALGVFDYVVDAPRFLRRMFDLAQREIIFSVPKPSLVRANLRKLRYGRHGVSVHFYDERGIRKICAAAGAREVRIDPIPAGYLVFASG